MTVFSILNLSHLSLRTPTRCRRFSAVLCRQLPVTAISVIVAAPSPSWTPPPFLLWQSPILDSLSSADLTLVHPSPPSLKFPNSWNRSWFVSIHVRNLMKSLTNLFSKIWDFCYEIRTGFSEFKWNSRKFDSMLKILIFIILWSFVF